MLKSQRSRKITGTCTSAIIVKETAAGIDVKYYKTHYGHELNLAHVPLPPEAKNKIASQLLKGIPPTKILNQIRENVDSKFKRIHLCTLKDINNIAIEITYYHEQQKKVVHSQGREIIYNVYKFMQAEKAANQLTIPLVAYKSELLQLQVSD
ncbi:hypothetical protein FQA39_LY03190 [Lamprigera yunnana]|nr:hypothetical protein FQA39_LY03190 [Lamprigera yunnana]